MEGLAFDTCFLIDLQRELRQRRVGSARALLSSRGSETGYLPAVALGEFAEGFSSVTHPMLVEVSRAFVLLPLDEATALRYGEIVRKLRAAGNLIGTNDLWIAATALRFGLPLVTNNDEHFGRVAGLSIVTY